MGWDESYERMEAMCGLETHEPASVTIVLQRKWDAGEGWSGAIYRVDSVSH